MLIFELDKNVSITAMVSKLDQSVGNVVKALYDKNMLENSIIMFMSDNGAPTVGTYATTGSNYPFRGVRKIIGAFYRQVILVNEFLIFNPSVLADQGYRIRRRNSITCRDMESIA